MKIIQFYSILFNYVLSEKQGWARESWFPWLLGPASDVQNFGAEGEGEEKGADSGDKGGNKPDEKELDDAKCFRSPRIHVVKGARGKTNQS